MCERVCVHVSFFFFKSWFCFTLFCFFFKKKVQHLHCWTFPFTPSKSWTTKGGEPSQKLWSILINVKRNKNERKKIYKKNKRIKKTQSIIFVHVNITNSYFLKQCILDVSGWFEEERKHNVSFVFNVKYANSYFCFLMSVVLCAAVCVGGGCTELKASGAESS